MIEVGGLPVLVHLMRWYYSFGFDDFVICAGYRSWEIKQYFLNYGYRVNHIEIDHRTRPDTPPECFGRNLSQEKWRVRVIDTGEDCMTGGRIARAYDEVMRDHAADHFAVTYGDGLSDVDLRAELQFHLGHGRIGTLLGVPPLSRFGELDVGKEGNVRKFVEKPKSTSALINGGFFFFKKSFRDYLKADASCVLEQDPLARLASDGELVNHTHLGFWQPMDTLRDKNILEEHWSSGHAPWKQWA
jgi:glucose-1-phosphate cytidylyltransferase